jgi:bifunctional UDP-N-acetylglucosamine pyrophosphorylase/glucosamine-1-phosphate N-acetyltransferase
MTTTAVILAAGLGTRMKSALPKALHPIAGRPMLSHLLASAASVFDRIVVVTGPEMEAVARIAAPHPSVIQHERLGTAHAALQAAPLFAGEDEVAILYADNPLITPETLRRLAEGRGEAGLALLAMRPADPARYGRVLTNAAGDVTAIVEWAEADAGQRAVGLCNAGVFCAAGPDLARWLGAVRAENAKGEYYLTDVVALAVAEGRRVVAVEADPAELRGINSRAELAEAEATVQVRLRRAALEGGATLTAPETVFLSADTVLEPDVTVGPHVVFGPGVVVRGGAEILAFSHLEGCVVAGGARIGPYARLRPGAEVGQGAHVGNFVELKATRLGAGAKANHLAYLGDAEIGAGSNIGAGTITCNYDGHLKHRTVIGEGAFVGSNATLVAPVALGDGSFIAAGSTITEDVAPDALAFGRARQVAKPGGGSAIRATWLKPRK